MAHQVSFNYVPLTSDIITVHVYRISKLNGMIFKYLIFVNNQKAGDDFLNVICIQPLVL